MSNIYKTNSGGGGGFVQSPIRFFAYVSTAQNNVTGDGTHYQIPFDIVVSNVGSGYNPATGLFTAPTTGMYEFNTTITYSNTGAATAFINALEGSVYNFRLTQDTASNAVSGTLIGSASSCIQMTAGDTIAVTAAAFGTTKTVSIFGQAPNTYATTSVFSGFLV